MTIEMALVLIILAIAIVLFITEKLRVDMVALLVLIALILSKLVSIEEAFAGFASPAVVTVWAVFIVGNGIYRTGVADVLASMLLRLAGNSPTRLLVVLMLTAGGLSAFMNNVGAVAILLPPTMAMCRELNIAPSRFLIPLSFASLLGGNITLIGTPPNILASDMLRASGAQSFAFFDFAPIGLTALAVGIVYMAVFGRFLLPDRTAGGELASSYPLHNYLAEVRLLTDSPLVNQALAGLQIGEQFNLNILYVRRGDQTLLPSSDRQLQAGDVLLVEGQIPTLMTMSKALRLQLVDSFSATAWPEQIETPTLRLSEIALAPRSRHADSTLKEIDFRARFNVSVLALRHNGQSLVERIADTPLSVGDALLVQGTDAQISKLHHDPDFLVLTTPAFETRTTRHAPLALAILLGVIVIAATGWLHIAAAMLIGAVLFVLFGVLTMDDAYRAIDWKAVFLIACMLPLGTAMETTGTAQLLAQSLVNTTGAWGPLAVLITLFAFTMLVTEVISNAAATVLVVPIALATAAQLGANPQAFVMATVLAASTSFLLPIGHQANVIIFSPGGYRFSDFARVGLGLNILMLLVAAIILPIFWPLF